MKKLMMMIAMFAIAGIAVADIVGGDFEGQTLTGDNYRWRQNESGWRSASGTITLETEGANDYAQIITGAGGGESGVGQWFDVSGLTAGTTYNLQFDIRIVSAGLSPNVSYPPSFSYSVWANNGETTDGNTDVDPTGAAGGDAAMSIAAGETSTFILDNIAYDITSTADAGWVTVTSSDFTFDGTDTMLGVGFALKSFYQPGQSIDIDNVSIVPEPATVGMLGLGALVALLIRRIRA